VSRIGLKIKAIPINKELDDETYKNIMERVKFCDVIAFDEAQFFSSQIVDIAKELAYQGKRVLIAGLNLDYRGKSFGSMGELMTQADEIVNLTAYCSCCGRPAIFTQRLIDGKPVKDGPVELIGDVESYEPRCRLCFVPPEKA
jgi:thymidine kinase